MHFPAQLVAEGRLPKAGMAMVGNVAGVSQLMEIVGAPGPQAAPANAPGQDFAAVMQQNGGPLPAAVSGTSNGQADEEASANNAAASSQNATASSQNATVMPGAASAQKEAPVATVPRAAGAGEPQSNSYSMTTARRFDGAAALAPTSTLLASLTAGKATTGVVSPKPGTLSVAKSSLASAAEETAALAEETAATALPAAATVKSEAVAAVATASTAASAADLAAAGTAAAATAAAGSTAALTAAAAGNAAAQGAGAQRQIGGQTGGQIGKETLPVEGKQTGKQAGTKIDGKQTAVALATTDGLQAAATGTAVSVAAAASVGSAELASMATAANAATTATAATSLAVPVQGTTAHAGTGQQIALAKGGLDFGLGLDGAATAQGVFGSPAVDTMVGATVGAARSSGDAAAAQAVAQTVSQIAAGLGVAVGGAAMTVPVAGPVQGAAQAAANAKTGAHGGLSAISAAKVAAPASGAVAAAAASPTAQTAAPVKSTAPAAAALPVAQTANGQSANGQTGSGQAANGQAGAVTASPKAAVKPVDAASQPVAPVTVKTTASDSVVPAGISKDATDGAVPFVAAAAAVPLGETVAVASVPSAMGMQAPLTVAGAGSGTTTGAVAGSGFVSAAEGQAGQMTGLTGSGTLPHTTLSATPTSLEVGVSSGTHGWLKIRAELNEAGGVDASLTGATPAAASKLRADLPALNSYLQDEKVSMGALDVRSALHTATTAMESGSTFSQSASGQNGSGQQPGSGQAAFGQAGAGGSGMSADAGAAQGQSRQSAESVPVLESGTRVDEVVLGRSGDAAAYGNQTELDGSDGSPSAGYGAGGGWLNVRA